MHTENTQKACTIVGTLLANLVRSEDNAADATSASIAVSMAALTVTASSVMEGFDPDNGKIPTADHILFAALLVWGSCHLESSGRLAVEFSPEMILDTMSHFEKFTGQSARQLLNKSLMAVIDRQTKVDPTQFGQNARFLPN